MGNAVEALKMAGSVLLFVLALSIVMIAFTNARQSLDIILSYADRESLTIENDSRYYYLSNEGNSLSRTVGKETIIPALYRSSSENYAVVFKFKNENLKLYEQRESLYSGNWKPINSIDKLDLNIIEGIIYSNNFEFYNGRCRVNNTSSLYEYLNGKKFKEELGTYYMEDVNDYDYHTTEENASTYGDLSKYNKTLKRIITYTEID